ncbi:MAG TPA: hypothetical protein VK867_01625 [Candidatus Limnocylindrales bacterium]|nr:hypothetical protein [Candidatus Limnocylindrales bacterium]
MPSYQEPARTMLVSTRRTAPLRAWQSGRALDDPPWRPRPGSRPGFADLVIYFLFAHPKP